MRGVNGLIQIQLKGIGQTPFSRGGDGKAGDALPGTIAAAGDPQDTRCYHTR